MPLEITTDPVAIVDAIEPLLLRDPVRNTVLGSIRDQVRGGGGDPWCARNAVALAVRSESRRPVAVSEDWTDLGPLTDVLAGLPDLVGLGGPTSTVDRLVERLGRPCASRIGERLFRLDRLSAPAGVPGRARVAAADDVALVAGWVEPFTLEAFGALPPDFDAEQWAANVVRNGTTWLWFDADEPVSMAARRPPAAGVCRVGPVYTPPPFRGRGYGSAVTARAADDILALGAVPVLYADLANPTSNKIYQAIGFRPVADRVAVTFA
jgi:GNAT superfamily N-acetyltransferase